MLTVNLAYYNRQKRRDNTIFCGVVIKQSFCAQVGFYLLVEKSQWNPGLNNTTATSWVH